MKLTCNVEIYNRLADLTPNIARKRPQRSCLAIGRQSMKNEEIHLLLQTPTNKNGTKYKVFIQSILFTINHHFFFQL